MRSLANFYRFNIFSFFYLAVFVCMLNIHTCITFPSQYFWDVFDAIRPMELVLSTSQFYCWDFSSIYCIRLVCIFYFNATPSLTSSMSTSSSLEHPPPPSLFLQHQYFLKVFLLFCNTIDPPYI